MAISIQDSLGAWSLSSICACLSIGLFLLGLAMYAFVWLSLKKIPDHWTFQSNMDKCISGILQVDAASQMLFFSFYCHSLQLPCACIYSSVLKKNNALKQALNSLPGVGHSTLYAYMQHYHSMFNFQEKKQYNLSCCFQPDRNSSLLH